MIKKLIYQFLKIAAQKTAKHPNTSQPMSTSSFYDLKFTTLSGQAFSFEQLKGKKVLLVNTASECGYTPQYKELQALHEKWGNRIVVLGFPSNDFGAQEPGSNEEIGKFCERNYGVSFTLFEKSAVVGTTKNTVYQWLCTKSLNGWNEDEPTWNFSKYLVNEQGELTGVFSPAVSPLSTEITGN